MSAVMNFTIYRRDVQLEKNDRLMSVHTSSYSGAAWWKIITFTCSSKEIAGLDTKFVNSLLTVFSCGELTAGMNLLA